MVAVTVIFISMGALSYAAYGSATKTVIILNMPQDNKLVNSVQFIYSLAILLSTPLQIYPAIEITSQQLFSRTGKYNPWIKWKKNVFRFFMVALCAVIAWAGAGQLDKFVALVGSFACIPLVFVYPVSVNNSHLLFWANVSTASHALSGRRNPLLATRGRHLTRCLRSLHHGIHNCPHSTQLGLGWSQGAGLL